jgi:hypothetical protein
MLLIAATVVVSAGAHAQAGDPIDRVVADDGSRADAPQTESGEARRDSVIARDADHLEQVLAQRVRGAVVEPLEGARLSVSLDRRRTAGSEILLVFNESWSATTAHLSFVRGGGALTVWDPSTGTRETIRDSVDAGDRVSLELDAAETLLLTLELASAEPLQ